MLSGCWLHIKQPLSGTWGCGEEGGFGLLSGAAPGGAAASKPEGQEGAFVSLRDLGSPVPKASVFIP